MSAFKLPRVPAAHLSPDVEHRTRLRVAVLVNTLFAFWAYGTVDADLPLWLPALVTAAGSTWSHVRRGKSNFWLKWVLAGGMLYVLFQALDNLVRATMDPRLALAQLLLWLQTLNSFDLPRRKNLRVALLVTAILMVVAGTLSRSMAYGAMLAGYAFTVMWALHEAYAAEVGLAPLPIKRPLITSAGTLVGVMVLALPLFLLAPRQERQLNTNTLPMSVRLPMPDHLDTRIRNPMLSNGPMASTTNRGYQGFSEQLDLNIRSAPSETVVLRVKSDRPQYWRAMAFDRYDGRTWRMGEPEAVETFETQPFRFPRGKDQAAGFSLLQTFYIEEEQANIIFAADSPRALYFPTPLVWRDRYDGLRSPVALQKDMYYSVISETPVFDVRSLEREPARPLPAALQRFMQLPPSVTERTRAEVRRLTAGKRTPFAKMEAMRAYLQTHFVYRLDVPEAPAGAEWVDHFLFEQRAGFCEQFATSLAVMGRLAGVPTRLVTGFVPGDYNPFSGFYEVKGKHAHAWVEAWMPKHGWITLDPTPGADEFSSLNPDAPAVQNPAQSLFAYLFPWLLGRPWAAIALGLAVIGLAGLLWRFRALSGLGERVGAPTMLYRRLRRRTRRLGVPERPSDTPGEWLEAVARVPAAAGALSELTEFVRRYEAVRFGGADAEALAESHRAAEAALKRPAPRG